MQSGHSKPFSAQSPEQIAKDYGGNKAKIAQAMQMGIVDPTVGTLAGMFIDRMAAGAQQAQAPQGTVASQVFNPQTPPAQAPGGAGPGGLPPIPGAVAPQPPMPPQAPQDMQPMAPGMAGGGVVAFAGGESVGNPQLSQDIIRDAYLEPNTAANRYQLPHDASHPKYKVASQHQMSRGEQRHNNLLDLVQQFTSGGIHRQVGDADVHGGYNPLYNASDFGFTLPFAEGANFSAGVGNRRGIVPNEVHAGINYRFADGGIASLSVPDDMFNSSVGDSDIQHYAGGAAVGQYGPGIEHQAEEFLPGTRITSGYRTVGHNAQVGGVANSYHTTNNARDMVPPRGMSMAEFASKLKSNFGANYDVINEGDHVHIEPSRLAVSGRGAPVRTATPAPAPAAATAAPTGLAAKLPNQDVSAMQEQLAALTKQRMDDLAAAKRDRRQAGWAALGQRGLAMLMPQGASLAEGGEVPGYAAGDLVQGTQPIDAFSPDYLQKMQTGISSLMGPQSTEFTDLMLKDARQRASEETRRADRKEAANQALMNFGLALMASKNPNFLGSLGEAGMPAVAGLKADLKDIKKDARDAIIEGAQAEGYKRDSANKLATLTLEQAGHVATLNRSDLDRESRERTEKLQRDTQFAIEQIRQRGENHREELRDAAATDRNPYETKIVNVKLPGPVGRDGKPTTQEVTMPARTHKQTGKTEYYSEAIGDYVNPEYATALTGKSNVMGVLGAWAKQRSLNVGVLNGQIVWQNKAGDIGVIPPADVLSPH